MIEPAYLSIPPRLGSHGDEVLDLIRLCRPPEIWPSAEQELAVDALASYGPGGRWAALESATVEPRQNGKTTNELLPVTLYDLLFLPPDRIVWTAHLFKTARATFRDFIACIEYSAELSRRIKQVNRSHGEESIETTSGALLEFQARENGGPRGLSGKRIVFDEALVLSAGAMGAALPVLSTRKDAQVNYASSAGMKTSTQLRRLMKRGRAGGDPSLIYIEYRADGSWSKPPCDRGAHCTHATDMPGCALDDEARWRKANYATRTGRISIEYIRAERTALPPLEFGRERLGWEEEVDEESSLIDMDGWATRRDPASMAVGPVCFALDSTPERSMSAIGMTGRREDGTRHRQVLEHRPGMSWTVDRAIELDQSIANVGWVIDPSSPAGALIPELEAARLTVHKLSSRDTAQACGSMLTGATDGSGWHLGQAALDQAWRDARTVPSGDGERFARRKSSGDITPLMVIALSDHGFRLHEHDLDGGWMVGV